MESFNLEKKVSSPREELSYLREKIAGRERAGLQGEQIPDREAIIRDALDEYSKQNPEQVFDKSSVIPEKFREEIVLRLKPEEHDAKMSELISIVYEKGIINALDIIQRLRDPHLTDDFHRFLVQYLKEGYKVTGLETKMSLNKALNRTLFEVSLGYSRQKEDFDLKKFFELMEQFYLGMLSVADSDEEEYLTIEIANAIGSREFIFYVSVPDPKIDLFEKQLISVFPDAMIREQKDDFNIFNEKGSSKGVYLDQEKAPARTIRTHDTFGSDPMKVLLNVFSKLKEKEEAAAIQMIFKPVGDFYLKYYRKALSKVEKGAKDAEELHIKNTWKSVWGARISNFISPSPFQKDSHKDPTPVNVDSILLENIKNKTSSPIVSTNLRIIVSTGTEQRTSAVLKDIESAFNQFENTNGNKFKFIEFKSGKERELFKGFSFREFNRDYDLPLNIKELATVIHFPSEDAISSPELKTNKMKTSSAPLTIPKAGIYLGKNVHRNMETDIYFAPEDRMRHFYVIGQTGTGKTNLLRSMIIQDIQNGEGVCMIDPHGSDVQDVLANIPKERYGDVIYFDPSYTDRPMALNMLEYDRKKPEQKTFVVNELFSIFQKLYGSNPEAFGPMFEQYFRNATMLVIDDPETGSTLLDVSRVLSDKSFRELKLSRCKNPVVIQFWREIASKAGGEASLENIVPYITSKFDVFLANEIMRPVIAQEKSSFNFREIMDQKKILLVNLSKGNLGDTNSNLIGLILVGKILMAALSRVDTPGENYSPFYLYIDEFQNVTTNSIATILSEARKYKLSLNIAHQFIAQIDEKIRDSVFGNVGSMAVFRVGSDDAEFLEKQLSPVFTAKDIMNINNFNAYLKMLSAGVPIDAFNIKTEPPQIGSRSQIEPLKQMSYIKYGQDRVVVENQIIEKYRKAPLSPRI
ncbi:MAG TPA: type IV secretion system DNA-binding domain-containing protein [Candidatus Paceibacterota bacterium]|nr:type IV secretion system DNA-binding domain-containing protein [Candidatus Paceibacterota bacterium]HRZ34317.1 type IV secretion system DNA-binding domain-containing protein [Candidatus Paceibacterota bacterium]